MSNPSPVCTINSTATTNGVNVTAGAGYTIALASTAGVKTWSIKCIGTDELQSASGITSGLTVNYINKTATGTAPGTACALIFQSQVNSGIDQTTGLVDPSLTTTFGLYVLTTGGNRVGAVGETFENNATFGWVDKINAIIRNPSGASSHFWVDPRDHGAVVDGTTDDNAAVQTCIGLLNAAGGGEFLVPDGKMVVSGKVTFGDNITFRGTGPKSHWHYTGNTSAFEWTDNLSNTTANVLFDSFQISGTASAASAIKAENPYLLTIRRIVIIGIGSFNTAGIEILSTGPGNAAAVDICDQTVVFSCNGHGIKVTGAGNGTGNFFTISKCRIHANTGYGVYFTDGGSGAGFEGAIRDNDIEGNTGGAVFVQNPVNFSISENHFENSAVTAIPVVIDSSGGFCYGLTIDRNGFGLANAPYGIKLDVGGQVNATTITNNVFAGTSGFALAAVAYRNADGLHFGPWLDTSGHIPQYTLDLGGGVTSTASGNVVTEQNEYLGTTSTGFASIDCTGATDVNISVIDMDKSTIVLTGAVTADIAIVSSFVHLSALKGAVRHVYNHTTGNHKITFRSDTGTGVLIPPEGRMSVVCDGTNWKQLANVIVSDTTTPFAQGINSIGHAAQLLDFDGSNLVVGSNQSHVSTLYISTSSDIQFTSNIWRMRDSGLTSLGAWTFASNALSFDESAAPWIVTSSGRSIDAPTVGMTFVSQAAFSGATGSNRNTQNIAFHTGAPAAGGVAGNISFNPGNQGTACQYLFGSTQARMGKPLSGDDLNPGNPSPLRFGRSVIPITGNYAPNQTEYNSFWLYFTGSVTGTPVITLPAVDNWVLSITNATTGGTALTFTAGSGTVTIATGKSALIGCDGTNFVRLTLDT